MASIEVDINRGASLYHVLNELHVTHKCCGHENILGCKRTVQNQKILVSFESAKSVSSFSLFKQGCRKEEYVSYVIRGTLEALQCIHSRGNRVHGNINLNTVFLDKDCIVKLGFPARINNPDLEYTKKKEIDLDMKKIDFEMVGELACSLYHGKSGEKKMLLPVLLQDFVKLSSERPTISQLMEHGFLKEFNKFDKYQEDLKKLLGRKLLGKHRKFYCLWFS
ncbi:hypothetical protein ACET3Z_006779 [Daucus carota]